jgi:hypothetical protein
MNPNFEKSKNLVLKFAHINIILILTHAKLINKKIRSYLAYKKREKTLCIFRRRDNSHAAPRARLGGRRPSAPQKPRCILFIFQDYISYNRFIP